MHRPLLQRLGELEALIAPAAEPSVAAALEQVAFVRVGLRCIADAIGEIGAEVEQLESETRNRPGPGAPSVGPA